MQLVKPVQLFKYVQLVKRATGATGEACATL